MQSDYLEQDLTLTRDNVPIVLHDIYLDEVTDVASKFPSRGRYLADKNVTKFYAIDFDFEEIKTLRATERFTTGSQAAFYAGRFPIWKASFQLNSFEEELEFIDGLAKSMSSVNKLTLGEIDVPVISTPGVYVELKRPEFHKFSGKANFSKIVLRILQKFNYTTNAGRQAIIQCFDPAELGHVKFELGWKGPLVQLLSPVSGGDLEGLLRVNYTYWTSDEGLLEISKFAIGIGPEKDQLLNIDNKGRITPSALHQTARRLGMIIHPYTFRVDRLPPYVKSYCELLDLFLNRIGVDGLFTDFPDVTRKYIETKLNSNSGPQFNWSPLTYLFLGLWVSCLLV